MSADNRRGLDDSDLAQLRTELAGNNPPPTIDPTANVLKLVEQAIIRQDDLRREHAIRLDERFGIERQHREEIREMEMKYRDVATLSEKERVNALLAAQQAAVALDRTRAELTASALAERVDTSAKTLSAQVDATAKAAESAVTAAATALNARIAPLEQFRFEQGGAKTQQTEGKSENQWVVGVVIGVMVVAVDFVMRLSGK